MARKRGGIAGLWDRNKKAIKLLAPAALGMIPGVGIPLAAAAGAAMGGLDRPGKRGIGFDIGGGIAGGLQGAAMGTTGAAAKKGIASLFTPQAAPPGASSGLAGLGGDPSGGALASPMNQPFGRFAGLDQIGQTGMGSALTPPTTGPLASAAGSAAGGGSALGALGRGASKVGGALKDNWQVISGITGGLNTMMGQQQQEEFYRQRNEQDRRRIELEEQAQGVKQREIESERENRRRLTQLLMPFIQQQFQQTMTPQTPVR